MANTLRFKRGLVSTIPTALAGEPLFTTDTFDLYIGNGTTNTRFQKYIASGTTSQLLRGDGSLLTMPIVLTSPSTGQVLKYDGTNWVNSADAGVTGSGTAGQVTYWGSSSTITGNNNLFWDNTNVRLGIGKNVPSTTLDILTTSATISRLRGGSAANQGAAYFVTQGDTNTTLLAIGDGSTMVGGAVNNAMIYVNGSPLSFSMGGTTQMTLTSVGRLLLGSTTDNGLRFQVTGDGYFSGSVGIGTSSISAYSLRVANSLISSRYAGISSEGVIDNTSIAYYFNSLAATANTTFTLGNLYHFASIQGTRGASSTITNQYGFFVDSTLVGATNNYGFYGNIASGTGRWNLYMNGTAANYLNGQLSVGTTATDVGYLRNYATIPVLALQNPTTGTAVGDGFQLSVSGSLAYIWQYENSSMLFGTNATERMRLDASGNLGLGVTPSAWGGTSKGSIDLGLYGAVASSATIGSTIAWNAFHNGTSWIAKLTASSYGAMVFDNAFRWLQASTGTAGNAITFTQAMTLDASGRLGIGTTSPASKLDVVGSTTITNALGVAVGLNVIGYQDENFIHLNNVLSTGNRTYRLIAGIRNVGYDGFSIFDSVGNATRFVIHNTGNVGINTTSDAGFKLDVNGTMRVSGASTFGGNLTVSSASGTQSTLQDTFGGYRNTLILRNTADTVIGRGTGIAFQSGASVQKAYIGISANDTIQSSYDLVLGSSGGTLTIANSGAATFSSSLTVDSTTLVVDATNNRVGVGTNVPTSSLHVVGSVTKSHTTKTANYTMTESDYTVLCDTTSGGFTITLPAASGCSGRIYVIKKIIGNSGTNNITIDPNGSETIDGATTYALQCRSSVMIQSNGVNWWILAERVDTSCI